MIETDQLSRSDKPLGQHGELDPIALNSAVFLKLNVDEAIAILLSLCIG